MKLIFLAVMMVFPLLSEAGFRRGNSSHIVVCKEAQGESSKLLDIYELSFRYHLTPDFISTGNEFERAKNMIKRLSKLNPSREALYLGWLESFQEETLFIKGSYFVPVVDQGIAFVEDHCQVEQLVMQAAPLTPMDKRYTINQKLWDTLDLDNKAATIVHEIIYREAVSAENRHESSELTRKLNAYLHSTKMQKTTLSEWLKLLQSLQFHQAEAHGVSVRLNYFEDPAYSVMKPSQLQFYDENHLAKADIPKTLAVQLFGKTQFHECERRIAQVEPRQGASFVSFFPNGKLESLHITQEEGACRPLQVSMDRHEGYELKAHVDSISFRRDGTVFEMNCSGFRDLIVSLYVESPKVVVFRLIKQITGPNIYTIRFENNLPRYVINTQFSEGSTTHKRVEDHWELVPNTSKVDLY